MRKSLIFDNHDTDKTNNTPKDLSKGSEDYLELKESLQRYVDNPNMKKYTAKELRELRYRKRFE